MARNKWTPETPWFGGNKETEADWPTYVCRNPNCKSRGKSHPNCKCGTPSIRSQYKNLEYDASGGVVGRMCNGGAAHDPGCEHFLATGGSVHGDDPHLTIGHAAVHHGLLGLLGQVGKVKLADSDKHIRVLEDAKTQHAARASASGEVFKKTLGNHLGHHAFEKNHEAMSEKLQGHPLVGVAGKSHLSAILGRLSPAMIEKDAHPEAFRGAADYLHSAIRGDSHAKETLKGFIGPKQGGDIKADSGTRQRLKEFLDQSKENPASLLEVGGNLSHYLPEHGGGIGALAATATEYLSSLKPTQTQNSPLDEPSPVDRVAQAKYDRAIDIANHPLLVLQNVKEGTLLPTDLVTLKTIYPGLHKSLVEQATERLIDSAAQGEEIPYRQKQSLSLFLGQPMDSTLTPHAMQTIIRSAAPQQAQKQGPQQKRASAAELNQISKVDKLYALPNERRLIDKK